MILSILIALYLTVVVFYIRNMSGIPLAEEEGMVYRWMWILGFIVYVMLWPVTIPRLIIKNIKELKQEEKESK